MSKYLVDLDFKRPCRYVFLADLWDNRLKAFGKPIDVLLDTGSFNTVIHKALVARCGVMSTETMTVSIGGYRGEANICELYKLRVGGLVMEKVIALAVPFDGELKNHILLGTNVTNNWDFNVSRNKNCVSITEDFSETAVVREYPYRYCFNNKGQVMAFQEFEDLSDK